MTIWMSSFQQNTLRRALARNKILILPSQFVQFPQSSDFPPVCHKGTMTGVPQEFIKQAITDC